MFNSNTTHSLKHAYPKLYNELYLEYKRFKSLLSKNKSFSTSLEKILKTINILILELDSSFIHENDLCIFIADGLFDKKSNSLSCKQLDILSSAIDYLLDDRITQYMVDEIGSRMLEEGLNWVVGD